MHTVPGRAWRPDRKGHLDTVVDIGTDELCSYGALQTVVAEVGHDTRGSWEVYTPA